MPLHKSSRAPRLDPTMISAPLDDFRHTMHIGRGGDAFGDTSFLSTHGPGDNTTTTTGSSTDLGAPGNVTAVDSQVPNRSHGENSTDGPEASESDHLSRVHSVSVSSFTLDLDLGPSILGDVLGVMDGLGLDSTQEEHVFSPSKDMTVAEMDSERGASEDVLVCAQNEFNGKELNGRQEKQTGDNGDGMLADANWSKPKGLRPKVRFSDKREEIIRQASEEEEGQGFTFQGEDEDEQEPQTPTKGDKGVNVGGAGEAELTAHRADVPPSPASSHSSDDNGSSPLHCRRVETGHFETDSEEEGMGNCGRGYTFEDEFDDEIGL
ncbi:hypothetical protein NHX12_002087 [Muraenolepis orangiensis]|uniref:CRIB domain-containing protein n=1 Tax=Muraenolepis orangiensis TaxID=630683 RepID=A0A9Q0E3T1_9TELE|nr:hypothetical protein NHX12_002087 [Muraenolepis orangiensis]